MVCMKYLRLVTYLAALCLLGAAASLTALASPPKTAPAESAQGEESCRHGINTSRCPFCTPALKEGEGFCREHSVPEALCVQCRPFLKAVFQIYGDW